MTSKKSRYYRIAVFTALVCAAGVLLFLGWFGREETAPEHIILVSIDTLRRDHLPTYGYPRDTAPSIAELARSSVVFDNAVAASVNTAPSHASMLTGLYPPSHGVLFNRSRLNEDVNTLAEMLGEKGFRTGAFVSGFTLKGITTGLGRGFDRYDDDLTSARERTAGQTFSRAREWLQGLEPGRPVFLFFHLFDPHYPYSPPEPYARKFLPPGEVQVSSPGYPEFKALRKKGLSPDAVRTYEALYDGEILYADHYVGRLMEELKRLGLFDPSLVIVLSDHGETLGERAWVFDHGCRLFDEQVRVPLVIRFPGGRHGGRRAAAEAHHVDILPTVLDALDLPVPGSVEGVSLAEGLEEKGPPRGRALFTVGRSNPERVPGLNLPIVPGRSIRSVRQVPFKLISYPLSKGTALQLFQLTRDPLEREDVARGEPEVTRELFDRIRVWSESAKRDLPEKAPVLSPENEKALRSLGYIQ